MAGPFKILLVEDSQDDYILTRTMLRDADEGLFDLEWSSTCEEALARLRGWQPDVLLVDYMLGASTGIAFACMAREAGCHAPAILLTGYSGRQIENEALEAGMASYLDKNQLSGPLLERTIRFAIERQQILDRLSAANQRLEGANEALEQRVADRTLALAAANTQLQAANELLGEANRSLEEKNRILRETNLLIEKMFASIHVHLAFLDSHFNFIRVNRRYAEADGRTEDFFQGKNHFELYPSAENEAIFRQVVQSGVSHLALARPFVYPDHPERSVTYWDWQLIPVHEPDGSVAGLILSMLDVTEQQRTRQAISYQAYLLENIHDAIVAVDLDGLITAWNHAAEFIFGWDRDEALGAPADGLLQTRYQSAAPEAVFRRVRETGLFEGEALQQRRDGRPLLVEIHITELRDGKGAPIGYVSIQRDITRRREAEEQARRARERLEAQAEMTRLLGATNLDTARMEQTLADRIAAWLGDGCLVFRISADGQRLLPAAAAHRDPRVTERLQKALPTFEGPAGQGYLGRVAATRQPLVVQPIPPEEARQHMGPAAWSFLEHPGIAGLLAAPIQLGERLLGVVGVSRDHTGRPFMHDDVLFLEALASRAAMWVTNAELFAQARKELAERRRIESELNEIQRRLLDSVEEERLQLARELHDGPIQELYGVEFQIHALAEVQPETGDSTLDEMRAAVQSVIQSLRDVSMELRPPALTHLGLSVAIRSHCEALRRVHTHVEFHLDLDEENPRQLLSERTRLALFRICQVALTNVVRHSGASVVRLRLALEPDAAVLDIADNGKGFTVPERWVEMVRAGHLGLAGARERVDALGGSMEVRSAPGMGTSIRVRAPRATPQGEDHENRV
jgi:PAS domain S-box-containing protein